MGAYNAANRWTKKGIAITTSRWDANPGSAYTMGSHVSVYADGTVLVASGGVEIGQGLNTKVAMAAAQCLGVPLEKISVEKADLIMDLGNQLDAAIDIGQVQGGFVMALGYLFSEEQKVGADGKRLHLGSWEYKVPTAYDIPVEFNVSLLKNSPNPNGVRSSKAVAEPVMNLIASPYLAVKNAIYAARKELGYADAWFQLDA